MSHVDDAINEMFQATHMQMMRNCCRLEKMLLASIHMESRAKGKTSMNCHEIIITSGLHIEMQVVLHAF